MTNLFRRFLAVFGIGERPAVTAEERPLPETGSDETFTPGQVWRYRTRPAEDASRVMIGKIEERAGAGAIVHVKLVGLAIKNTSAPGGVSSVMTHAPISEAAFAASITELTGDAADLDGFEDGYGTWLSAFEAGDAGIFTITLAEIVDVMEQAFNQ